MSHTTYRPGELDNRFDYHKPDDLKANQHDQVRRALKGVAMDVMALTPPSREQSLAITKLEEAMFWANAAIARS